MDYITLPFVDAPDILNRYAGGVILYRLNVGSTSLATMKGCTITDNEVRCGVYKDNNRTYLLLTARLRDSNPAIMFNSSSEQLSYVSISVPEWKTGTSDWFYDSVDITDYINENFVTELTVFDSLSECFSAMVGSLVDQTIYVLVQYKRNDTNDQGGTSDIGGGEGTFDDTSSHIPLPYPPQISAANTGLVTLFKPTIAELQSLGSYLWTGIEDFIENLNKLFMNPMDYLIALNIFPVSPSTGTPRAIKIGSFTTSISMAPVISQWHTFNCGTVTLEKYWGSALDYAPNTKVSLFLPFIGSVTLNTDEVMGNDIGVEYSIDLLSGQCVAMVTVGPHGQNGSVLYQFTGEAGVSIPMTGADWSRIYSAGIGAVGTAITGGMAAAASGMAAGGATSALAGAQAAEAASNAGMAYSLINDTSKGVRGVATMREQMLQASQMALEAGKQAASAPSRVSKGVRACRIANTIDNTIGSVMAGKAFIQHTGTISGSAGMLGVKTPYLCVEFPNQSLAENYKHFVGYPSNIYARLGTLTGYTECESVYPYGLVNQTDSEVAEILESLKGGVYLNFNNVTGRGEGITLYTYNTPPNTIGKGAVFVETLTGTFRDSVSVTDPVFTIERSSPIGFNYVYIEAFNRFYYVTGMSTDLHGIVTVSCTVDPLETNAKAIEQMDAIIKRQENAYNLYLDDGIFKAFQNTKHKLIAFPHSFTDYSYILALAGNG